MDNKEVFSTLSDIRNLMEKSSKFLSLNGISAIVVGIYACVAAMLAYPILGNTGHSLLNLPALEMDASTRTRWILLLAGFLIVLSIGTVVIMCRHKAKKNNQQLHFDRTTRRLLWNFFLPLIVGGILCLSLIWQGHYGLTSSIMLLFYGIALINASNHTYSNIRYLGYAELGLGLADSFLGGHALLFWVTGFGVFHIIYGIFFHLKYNNLSTQKKRSME